MNRIVLVGLGATGVAIGQSLHDRSDCQIVGAVDVNLTEGTDLGKVLGVGDLGVEIVGDLALLPAADLAVVATTSDLTKVVDTLVPLIERNMNVLSICEQLAWPWQSHGEISAQLDEIARDHGVTVLGTGANPGVLMDSLPLLLSVLTQRVEKVVIRRRTSMARYNAILTKFGLGLTAEQFAQAQESGLVIGHVGFEQAIGALADGLGWPLEAVVVDAVQPRVTSSTRREGEHLTVEPGTISAVTHAARGLIGEQAVIDVEITFGFFDTDDDLAPGDDYRIEGADQILEMHNPTGFESFLSTAAVAVNVATAVVDAPPGFTSMADLSLRALASKGTRLAGPRTK